MNKRLEKRILQMMEDEVGSDMDDVVPVDELPGSRLSQEVQPPGSNKSQVGTVHWHFNNI